MATAQTYRRQFKKTFEIVDKVASEYYELLDQEKITEDDNFICTYSDLEKIESNDFKWLEKKDKEIHSFKSMLKLQETQNQIKINEAVKLKDEEINQLKNDLENVAFVKYRKLFHLKNYIETLPNIYFTRMTGSGSTIIGYFKRKKEV